MRYAVDVIVTIHLEADSVHKVAIMAVDEVIADGAMVININIERG